MKRLYNKNKTAQFYLLTAIIIIALILGLAAVTNYVKKRSVVKIYDVKDELNIESGNVLDFGTYKEYDNLEMEDLLEHFTGIYTAYSGEGRELYFILGSEEGIELYSYTELITGSIDVNLGGQYSRFIIRGKAKDITPLTPTLENKIIVTINDIDYEFNLQPGENFYFVISQEIEGEQHIVSG